MTSRTSHGRGDGGCLHTRVQATLSTPAKSASGHVRRVCRAPRVPGAPVHGRKIRHVANTAEGVSVDTLVPLLRMSGKEPGGDTRGLEVRGGKPGTGGTGDGFADTDAPPAPRACASSPGRRILTLVSKSGKSFFRTIESSFQRFKSPVSSRRRRCRGGGRLPRSPCKWRFSEEHSSATILGPVNHRPRKPRLCVNQQAGALAGSGTRPRARRPRREGGS